MNLYFQFILQKHTVLFCLEFGAFYKFCYGSVFHLANYFESIRLSIFPDICIKYCWSPCAWIAKSSSFFLRMHPGHIVICSCCSYLFSFIIIYPVFSYLCCFCHAQKREQKSSSSFGGISNWTVLYFRRVTTTFPNTPKNIIKEVTD